LEVNHFDYLAIFGGGRPGK